MVALQDPIADMLTRIRNAQAVRAETVEIPFSKLKYALAKILEQQGFVKLAEFKGRKPKKIIVVTLKYDDGVPGMVGAQRVSKSGQRVYSPSSEISKRKGRYGLAVLSTSQGLMVEYQAKKKNIGGEILCRVW